MYLGETLQLVLQTEKPGGGYLCEGFSNISIIHPCYIVLATDGTTASYGTASRLRSLIHQEVRTLDPSVSLCQVPCGGAISDPNDCHAHRTLYCRRLLVLVGSGDVALPSHSRFDNWMKQGDTYLALPIIPEAGKARLSRNLRPVFSVSNAVFYENDIAETVPAVFSAVGLTTEEHRIFISYRRKDTQDLADQLFDALTHEGFDVFLDRFRVPPALDFQRRLRQELADKSMVLVLESLHFDESEWTRYEIEFAVKHRLGLFALQTPGGKNLNGIENDSRLYLTSADYDNANPQSLTTASLGKVVSRIKLEHGRKLVWRRRILRKSMSHALASEGLHRQHLGPTGMIHVTATVSTGGSPKKEYAICLTPRPPELRDFHDTHLQTRIRSSARGLIVGPIASQEPARQQRLYWLGDVSDIHCFDEGKIVDVAKSIKGGAL